MVTAARRNEPLESHRSHSNRFLVHADEMIRKGDRLQASEKIWGAVAHILKAVANERGWEHDGHQRLRNVALHLQDHPAVANPEHASPERRSLPSELLQRQHGDGGDRVRPR